MSERDLEDQAEKLMKLASTNTKEDILMRLKFAYYPFAGHVMNNPDEKGNALLQTYLKWFKEVKEYLDK